MIFTKKNFGESVELLLVEMWRKGKSVLFIYIHGVRSFRFCSNVNSSFLNSAFREIELIRDNTGSVVILKRNWNSSKLWEKYSNIGWQSCSRNMSRDRDTREASWPQSRIESSLRSTLWDYPCLSVLDVLGGIYLSVKEAMLEFKSEMYPALIDLSLKLLKSPLLLLER